MIIDEFIRSFPPLVAILLVSLLISFIVTIVYKYTTNQKYLKSLHAEMKELRKRIKETKDTSEMTALNKQLMEKTMKQAMQSMKSTFITIIPIFFVFAWMGGNLAYLEVNPNDVFEATLTPRAGVEGTALLEAPTLELLTPEEQQVSDTTVWRLRGPAGQHDVTFYFNGEMYTIPVLITNEWDYENPVLDHGSGFLFFHRGGGLPDESQLERVAIELPSVHPFGDVEIFGWTPGWLATYFLFTLMFTFPMRRLLKVH